mgnify:FL=1
MKKTISILILGILPGVTLAGAGHGGGHGMKSSPEMGQMGHDSHNMSNTTHDNHESAAGQPGEWSNISRTVQVTMDDAMRFSPDNLVFKAGETVR